MSKFELKLPKMGESVAEATITGWLKEVGEAIELDEAIVEIATDKVDSEVPSEVEGVLVERLFDVDDVVEVGTTIAIIETNSEQSKEVIIETPSVKEEDKPIIPSVDEVKAAVSDVIHTLAPEGTGLVIAPSHRMMSDIPIQNVAAMIDAFQLLSN